MACLGTLLWLWQMPIGFAQLSVTDMSEELRQKFPIPKGYSAAGCQFAFQQDQPNSWWGCDVFILPEAREAGLLETASAFVELVSINEKGNLGQNQRIALKDEEDQWQILLAIGMKGTFLIWDFNKDDDFLVAALALPHFASPGLLKLPLLWQHDLPTRMPHNYVNFSLEQVTATNDGGYVILIQENTHEAYTAKRDWFALVRLRAEGQTVWQYIYEDHFLAEEREDKKFLIIGKEKTVLYGYFDPSSGENGTTILCLDPEGIETTRKLFKGYYWNKAIPWFQGGFAFMNYASDKINETANASISIFDNNCEKVTDQPLKLSHHEMEGSVYHIIKTAAIAPNGNMVIVYLQNQDVSGMSQSALSLPSLHLMELNRQGIVVCDVPLITGTDKNRAYLQVFEDGWALGEYGEEGDDRLKVNLLFPKQGNFVLVSVYNKGVDYAEHLTILPEHWFPKMYRVKLPCEAEIAQNFQTVGER